MKRLMMSAALVAMTFAISARAEETIDAQKAAALETCKKEMGGEANPETDKMCTCMVDNIVTVFGDDAGEMLQVLAANLNPSDTVEIAKLLGISEDEAKTWVTAADEKMDEVQKTCMPQ